MTPSYNRYDQLFAGRGKKLMLTAVYSSSISSFQTGSAKRGSLNLTGYCMCNTKNLLLKIAIFSYSRYISNRNFFVRLSPRSCIREQERVRCIAALVASHGKHGNALLFCSMLPPFFRQVLKPGRVLPV